MSKKDDAFVALCDWLKHMADETNAGRAFVDFKKDDGSNIRIEYKPAKKGGSNERI